jgi:hypothetical protein
VFFGDRNVLDRDGALAPLELDESIDPKPAHASSRPVKAVSGELSLGFIELSLVSVEL